MMVQKRLSYSVGKSLLRVLSVLITTASLDPRDTTIRPVEEAVAIRIENTLNRDNK